MPVTSFPVTADIITQARSEALVGSNPIAAPLDDDSMYQRLHDINMEACQYPKSVGYLGWLFMDREVIISTIANTALNGAISSGASTFTVDSASGFDVPSGTCGAGYIRDGKQMFDFFTYESLSGNIFSNVSDISEAHADDEEVHKVYALPSDYGYQRALYKQSVYLKYHNADIGLRQVPAHPFFSIVYLKSTTYFAPFLVFPYKINSLNWKLLYQKAPVDVLGASDRTTVKLDLPTGHGRRYYIEKLKAFIHESEGNDADRVLAEQTAQDHLEKLLDAYQTESLSGDEPGLILGDW